MSLAPPTAPDPRAATVAGRPEGDDRARWLDALSLVGVLAVWIAMTLSCWSFVARYASPIAYQDDLELAPALAPDAQLDASFYWTSANEHRIALPRLIYLALLGVTRDFRSGMFFQVAVLALLALALVFAARRLRGASSIADAFFPLALLHRGNPENLLLGMQITIVVPIALVMLAVWLALHSAERSPGPPRTLAAAGIVACLLLLPLNGGFGLMQTPPLLALAVAGGVAQIRASTWSDRRAGLILLGGALAFAALVAFYFVGFEFPPSSDRVFSPLRVLWTAILFLSLNFGPIGQHAPVLVGIAALVVPVAALVVLARAWRADRAERWRVAALAAGMAAAATIALAIGSARGSASPEAGLACRYVILPAAWMLCAYLALCRFGPRKLAHALHVASAIALAALLPFHSRYGAEYGERRLWDSTTIQTSVNEGRELDELVREHWASAYTSPDGYRLRLLQLRAAGYPPFRRANALEPIPDVAFFECSPPPLRIVAPEPARSRRLLDRHVLTLRADAEVVLPVPIGGAGARELVASYGMLPNAWKGRLTAGGRSDGLAFRVELRSVNAAPRVLWERELHPAQSADDRGAHELRVELPRDAAGELALVVRNVSGSNRQYDWAFWSQVALR